MNVAKNRSKTGASASEPARRSSSEVRDVILESARTLFAHKGYSDTTMRDIAEHAGLHLPAIYRKYPSKAELFEAAVLVPLYQAIAEHVRQARDWDDAAPLDQLIESWVVPLHDIISANWKLLVSLMAAESFNLDGLGETRLLSEGLRQMFEGSLPHSSELIERGSIAGRDPQAAAIVMMGMLIGTTIVRALLADRKAGLPSASRVRREMVMLSTYGLVSSNRDKVSAQASDAVLISRRELERTCEQLAEAEARAVRAEAELRLLRSGRARR